MHQALYERIFSIARATRDGNGTTHLQKLMKTATPPERIIASTRKVLASSGLEMEASVGYQHARHQKLHTSSC
jgi:hypothetical protein